MKHLQNIQISRFFFFIVLLCISAFSFSQTTHTAKLLDPNGENWEGNIQKPKSTFPCDMEPNEKHNLYSYKFIKGRLGYLSHDDFGGKNILSIQHVTKAEGEAFINEEPKKWVRKTCLSVSYDMDWVDFPEGEKESILEHPKFQVNGKIVTPAIDSTKTSPKTYTYSPYAEVVYAYSVANAEHPGCYDVYYYVSDDSTPLVEGSLKKLFKTGSATDECSKTGVTINNQPIFSNLSGIADWDFENITDFEQMFANCTQLNEIDLNGVFKNSKGVNTMFQNCTSLESVSITGITDEFTSFAYMFANLSNLKDVTISGNFSGVKTSSSMFSGCINLTSADLNGEFEVLSGMTSMFLNCKSLKSTSITEHGDDADVSLKGNFSNVTSLGSLFNGCSELQTVLIDDVFGNTPQITSTNATFYDCSKLTNCDLNIVFGPALTNMKSMFSGCKELPSVVVRCDDFSNITTTNSMFNNCYALTSALLDGIEKNFSSTLENMANMFYACKKLSSISITEDGDDADVSLRGDFSGVKNLSSAFRYCETLKDVLLQGHFSSLNNISNIFADCNMLENTELNGTFSSLTSLNSLFSGRNNLKTAILKGDFNSVNTINNIFKDCTSLDEVVFDGIFSKINSFATLFNKNASLSKATIKGSFDALESMSSMFNSCTNLSSVVVDGDFPLLTTMANMFYKCEKIKSVAINDDVSANATIKGAFPNVTNIESMFRYCTGLQSAIVNGFESLETLKGVFSYCSDLKTVSMSGNFSNVTTTEEMFRNSLNLSTIEFSGDADFSSLVSAQNMFSQWSDLKYEVFKSMLSQMTLDIDKFPGGKSNPYRVTSSSISGRWKKGVDENAVATKNGLVYKMDNGYMVYWHTLPIELEYFSVSQKEADILFSWQTTTETNNAFFTLEYSLDGVKYNTVASVDGNGTTSQIQSYGYQWKDVPYTGLLYFRLKQTDFNGVFSYSNVVVVPVVCKPCNNNHLQKINYGEAVYRVFDKRLIYCEGDNRQ